MNDMDTQLSILFASINQVIGTPVHAIKMTDRFVRDLGADSLDMILLIDQLQSTFDVRIPNHVAEDIETVGDAWEYIKNNVDPNTSLC